MNANPKIALTPHPLVARMQTDGVTKAVRAQGFVGTANEADHVRLHPRAGDLTDYIDVPAKAVLHARTLGDDGRVEIWIRPDAASVYRWTHRRTGTLADLLK